jgi:DNA-damage-inducible protein D
LVACKQSGQNRGDHFRDITEMVEIGSKAKRAIRNQQLSRYGCYLIVQNADPSKKIVALAQTYFAIQTRKQEVGDLLEEDRKRVAFRGEITERNKILSSTAKSVMKR